MVILGCMFLGAIVGGLDAWLFKQGQAAAIAIGTLGALLGLVADRWIGLDGPTSIPYCEYLSAALGAALLLGLWNIALRLFLNTPSPAGHE